MSAGKCPAKRQAKDSIPRKFGYFFGLVGTSLRIERAKCDCAGKNAKYSACYAEIELLAATDRNR